MTDTPTSKSDPLKAVLEHGPLVVFFVFYFYLRRTMDDPSTAIYPAALVFTVLAVIGLLILRVRTGKWPGTLVFATAIISVTTGLGYVFKEPRFFYMKPTIINAALGFAILGGLFFKKNFFRLMMGEAFKLPEKAWTTLAVRWGLFFLILAVLNEGVWRNFDEPTWVKFKLFGFLPLTFLFAMSQVPFIMKHGDMSTGTPAKK